MLFDETTPEAEVARDASPVVTDRSRRDARRRAGRALLKSRRGMSLVEVMVVIAIILTLMSIIGFGVIQVYQQSQVDTTKLTMSKINQQVQIYQLRKKKLPSSGGLSEIFDGEDPPRDSWDNEFVFVVPGPGNSAYDIISLGSDGQDGGAGNAEDIKWSEIGK